ncbi:xanthine dehydrogenase [bacterium LRH843]|nr:xanthine dehydrogenase [bacterium LRH843]
MISYDFEYVKPTTIEEAIDHFQTFDRDGKQPIYYSGGTEIITLGRLNQIVTGAVIDIKAIPECTAVKHEDGKLILGAALSLTDIAEINVFPFLSKTISGIADHTARNKITLGGNICSNIIYREAVLPLLLTESEAIIASSTGLQRRPIAELFNGQLHLEKGEFLVQVTTKLNDIDLPFLCIKKRRQWDVGYPLITTAALKKDDRIKIAFSGLASFPFRHIEMEESLNHHPLSKKDRIEKATGHVFEQVLDDVHGSAEYRMFVLKNTLMDVLDAFEGEINNVQK